ncbi:hypothetical protein ACQKQD_29795 [Methylobacterium sp. NPDC080182]|uniref:hypothetical protein n=1 Tax=Methylobacterium sp. NPDC080182 TaxID=3390590 RepID=UPI003D02329F
MSTLWCFLKDLTDSGFLIFWEGSVMDRAMRKLIPMCEHGFAKPEDAAAAQGRARMLLTTLRADGLYR